MDRRIRVLLIDDHEMARRGLEAMLAAADWIDVVGGADGCEAGLELATRLKPDVVLLDIRMPGMDGLMCLDRLKELEEPVAVLMVTLYDDQRQVMESIRRGAAGYLLKDATADEVISAIQNVAAGQMVVEGRLLRAALATAPVAAPEPGPSPLTRQRAEAFQMTPREQDVLRLLAEGLTNKEIGSLLSIGEDTVKKHVQNLIWKLRAADRTQAAILAYRMGLIDPRE